MATALASHFSHTGSSASNMPKGSTSRRSDAAHSKRVVLFCNGDKFFKGKKIFIIPSRYQKFSDFLNDLTGKLPNVASLPYGVRQLFSPTSGRKIRDLEELGDGKGYVCAGFEQFRPLNYGEFVFNEAPKPSRIQIPKPSPSLRPRHIARVSHDEPKVAHVVKESAAGASLSREVKSPRDAKSKLFVVISNAVRPRKIIRMFLNPHAYTSMDRLLHELQRQFADVSAGDDASKIIAAGEFSSGRIRRIYSIFGVEITSAGEFFKVGDHYIALGSEKFTTADLKEIINIVYPNGTAPKNIFKSWENQRSRKRKPKDSISVAPAVPAVTGNQKPQAATPTAAVSETKELSQSENVTSKATVRTVRTGAETVSVTAALPPPVTASSVPVVESRSKVENERLKKDSGFVEDTVTKESNSPSYHVNHPPSTHSVIASSTEQLPPITSEQHKSPRFQAPPQETNELPTVFEVKSVESTEKPPERVNNSRLSQPDKTLKPVQIPSQRPKPSPLISDAHLPSPGTPSDVTTGNAHKTTREVDKDLANVLDQQQLPSSNIQKYSVLPDIGQVKNEKDDDVVEEAVEVEKKVEESAEVVENQSPKQAEEQEVLDETPKLEVMEEKANIPVPTPQPAPEQNSPTPAQQSPVKLKPDSQTSKSQQAPSRPTLEHQPLIIDGRPESRAGSQSSSAPSSAPGRIVHGKLSRQLSRIDHVVARFEYVGTKQLGDGNFAVVKKCRRRKTGNEYAMKIIDKAKLKGKFHMVENEIRIMRSCDHQNLVKLYEMYETDKEIFLVMELVPDGDLFDAITAAVKFDESTASKMVHDMASGLFYLHSRRIVHRDMKPENLLVLRQPKSGKVSLKLGDFGLAMEVAEPIYSVCGTPTYVAPEILSEKGYGLEVDLWALGVISYILLCGFPPFRSQKRRQSELFEQIKSGRFVFLSPYWDSISVLAKELISKLLVVDARRRYTSSDVLCHPWVISHGGSSQPQGDMATYRKTLRKSLDEQARANLKQWMSVRQKKGFVGALATNGTTRNT